MYCFFKENAESPIVLLHGGAGNYNKHPGRFEESCKGLQEIVDEHWPDIVNGQSAVDAVCALVGKMELNPVYNAGLGGNVQSDGIARLTASLMDGSRGKFSAVQLATQIKQPSVLAKALQEKKQSVLGAYGSQLLMRELGIAPENPVTPAQAEKWAKAMAEERPDSGGHGTVGAVVMDSSGNIAAGTSTGGCYFNYPGRISDVGTVAGNYASGFAGLSATGIGEHIVDYGLAVRTETRVRDGKSVVEASKTAFEDAKKSKSEFGWIALDQKGSLALCCTTENMPALAMAKNFDCPVFGS